MLRLYVATVLMGATALSVCGEMIESFESSPTDGPVPRLSLFGIELADPLDCAYIPGRYTSSTSEIVGNLLTIAGSAPDYDKDGFVDQSTVGQANPPGYLVHDFRFRRFDVRVTLGHLLDASVGGPGPSGGGGGGGREQEMPLWMGEEQPPVLLTEPPPQWILLPEPGPGLLALLGSVMLPARRVRRRRTP